MAKHVANRLSSWPLWCNGDCIEVPILYTHRQGSVALRRSAGGWQLLCPKQLDVAQLHQALRASEAGFNDYLAQQAATPVHTTPMHWQAGSAFSWLGQTWQMAWQAHDAEVAYAPLDAVLSLRRPTAPESPEAQALLRQQIAQVLRVAADEVCRPRVMNWAQKMGVEPKALRIKSFRACWGNCYPGRGLVQLNWRLLQAPIWVVDYVIVHELAHLVHANHSPNFWALVRAYYPETDKAKAYLKQHSASMMAFLQEKTREF